MKKSGILLMMAAAAMLAVTGCGGQQTETTGAAAETSAAETEAETTEAETEAETASAASEEGEEEHFYIDDTLLRVGSLKGPTTIGLVNMMEAAEADELPYQAEFTMATTGDELTAKMVSGDMDIALVPANLASVLYNKTEGQISVIDINTLGVL